jgi:type IV pilus assembly protein PilM
MIINNPFKGAFGIDIGDSSIKIVQLIKKWRPGGKSFFDISDIRQIALPKGAVSFGEILDSEAVTNKLRQLLGAIGKNPAIKNSWVVASLPVSKSFLKLIVAPVSEKELNDKIIYDEVSKHLPMDISEIKIDWQIINDPFAQKNATHLLIGAVPIKTISDYSNILKSAGLHPLAMEIEDLSIARAMITSSKTYKNEARAILDLGGSRSSVIIYDKGSIQFSSLVNFSGDYIDQILSKRLNIEHAESSNLKTINGLNYNNKHPEYLKIMIELADELVHSISDKITYYQNHFRDTNPVTHITVSGGLSIMTNLDKYITNKIKIETAPGNVWKNLLNKKIKQDSINNLAFASAIGLALRATEWPIKHKK